jgi:hypothetical protein
LFSKYYHKIVYSLYIHTINKIKMSRTLDRCGKISKFITNFVQLLLLFLESAAHPGNTASPRQVKTNIQKATKELIVSDIYLHLITLNHSKILKTCMSVRDTCPGSRHISLIGVGISAALFSEV